MVLGEGVDALGLHAVADYTFTDQELTDILGYMESQEPGPVNVPFLSNPGSFQALQFLPRCTPGPAGPLPNPFLLCSLPLLLRPQRQNTAIMQFGRHIQRPRSFGPSQSSSGERRSLFFPSTYSVQSPPAVLVQQIIMVFCWRRAPHSRALGAVS